jgi:hypothetical protein
MIGLRILTMFVLTALAALPCAAPAAAKDGPVPVDAEVVLAVDISYSMNNQEQQLQRAGYVAAIRSPEFLQALAANQRGKIALLYLEWSGYGDQKVLVDWSLVDGKASADAFADRLAEAPFRRAHRTSISGAIDASMKLFEGNGFQGDRRIIDISGDGPNNDGRGVVAARDDAVAQGITINGLPLVGIRDYFGFADIKDLDIYFADCVIGGVGAFMVPVTNVAKFVEATRSKLVQEISQRELPSTANLILRAAASAPRIPCTIGETKWQQRFGN